MNINNSKYIFYAFNKKWKSIRECCKYYEVRYGSVMSYKRIHKCTAEEAIAYCRNLKKLGIFYFKKVRWTDLKECCDYYNINYKSLCTYMQKNKISKEEALSHYYQYYKYKLLMMERRMRGNSHVRCEVGESLAITSKDYLSL